MEVIRHSLISGIETMQFPTSSSLSQPRCLKQLILIDGRIR